MTTPRKTRAKRSAEELPDEDRKYLNMRLKDEDRDRLKRIIGKMLHTKGLKRGEGFSYQGAARFAFRRCLESMEAGG